MNNDCSISTPPLGDEGLVLALLLLGSNQGDRVHLLQQARRLLSQYAGKIVQQSALYESEPWGFASPCWFINQVVEVETALPPLQLLSVAQQIEKTLGREKPQGARYAARTMDIDILFFGGEIICTSGLIVPHPRLHERRFTLMPLCEIAPEMKHPVLKKTIRTLLQECEDAGKVFLMES
ncbi:MAG: 2-amino-4-hydroxy-6-hydroxymethyldihydropteridine diphosphokinase [Prevotellaceae bacterium]|jgi:2-amino-4-hydroxy-6-hydroxymethyldihydropteridine diphosphokinase|nr:2-amino-4-hydroxy-6-hydroxymethyldihydropteridine diphosphokinase [Prevotellaceae bacterium]